MDYKKLYEEIVSKYATLLSATHKLREALTKSQERIIELEEELEKYVTLEDLINELEDDNE